MPICHGYHGLFASCGGVSGAAGSVPIHQIGGMRHEVTLWHLAKSKNAPRTKAEQEKYSKAVSSAKRKANTLADLTPRQTAILTRERAVLADRLAHDKTLTKPERARMRAEVTLLTRHLKRAEYAADLRRQKTDLLQIQAAHYAKQATERKGAERQVAQHYADKAAAELEAYQRREAVHYVHADAQAKDTLRALFGHEPTRSEIAGALGVKPGSDITLSRIGNRLHATVRSPGYSPFIKRTDITTTYLDLFRDAAGRLQVQHYRS